MEFINTDTYDLEDGSYYNHTISWRFDEGETFDKVEVAEDDIVKGSSVVKKTSNSVTIAGYAELADLWHETATDYLRPSFKLDGTEHKNAYSPEMATLDDFREQLMHYTGKSYLNKGIRGMYLDNKRVYVNFEVIVYYWYQDPDTGSGDGNGGGILRPKIYKQASHTFSVWIYPSFSPKYFGRLYMQENGGVNEKGDRCDYFEFKEKSIKHNSKNASLFY